MTTTASTTESIKKSLAAIVGAKNIADDPYRSDIRIKLQSEMDSLNVVYSVLD